MKDVYFISGLGADEEVFSRLNLDGMHAHFIKWVEAAPSDTLADYAKKLCIQITTPNPVIVGLSFGGMLAVEIAKLISCEKIILISSIKHSNEKPPLLRMAATTGVHRLVPVSLFTTPGQLIYRAFGVHRHPNLQELVDRMLLKCSTPFISWAINRIVNWQNTEVPNHLVHIHGTRDQLFKPEYIQANYWVQNGSHLMVWTHAGEVSRLLKSEIL